MNKRQLIVLWCGIGLLVLIGLYPPCIVTTTTSTSEWESHTARHAERRGIVLGAGSPTAEYDTRLGRLSWEYAQSIGLNADQLLLEVGIIIIVTGGLMVTLRQRRPMAAAS